jgi:hypothetical protein
MEVVTSFEDGGFIDRTRQVSPPDDRAMDPPGGPPPSMSSHEMMAPPPGGPSPRMPGGPPPGGPRMPGGPPGGRPGGPPGGRGGRGFGGRRGFGGGRSMSSTSASAEQGTAVNMRGSTPGMPPGGPPPVSPVYIRPKTPEEPEEPVSSSEDDSSDDEGALGVGIEQSFVAPEDDSMEEVPMRVQNPGHQTFDMAPVQRGGAVQEIGGPGGAGARYESSDEEDAGTEFQQMQQQWLDERRDLKMKLRARDTKLQQAKLEIEDMQEAVQLARDRAYAAEAEAEAAKAAPPPNEALMSMIERLQGENRQLRKDLISPTVEDEAEKLMAFSDEMDERTEEIKTLRAELDRVNADNARLAEKARSSAPPHGVAKVTAVKVAAVVAPGQFNAGPEEEVMAGPPSDAAQAEVMDLRKQCNRLRFQLSEANQRVVKLQQQVLASGGGYNGGGGDVATLEDTGPRRDAWSNFGAARDTPDAPDPFGRPAALEPARRTDSAAESLPASSPMTLGGPQRDGGGGREEGMMGDPRMEARMEDPRAEDSQATTLATFESGGRMAVGTREGVAVEPRPDMFQACGTDGKVGVYMINRCSIKYGERMKGQFECYTITEKVSGEFVMVAVRETGLSNVVGASAPLRMFCEDVKPACYNGIAPDGSQPSYMGKLVPKSEARGKVFSLFRCRPHKVGLDKKEQEALMTAQDMHAWIKVKWKSLAKVPEPRRIKVQLQGAEQSTRMLRNFCAEKRCARWLWCLSWLAGWLAGCLPACLPACLPGSTAASPASTAARSLAALSESPLPNVSRAACLYCTGR